MAEFKTKCSHCNTVLAVKEAWIGMEVECPLCHKKFVITAVHTETPVKKRSSVHKSDDSGPRKRKKIWIALAIADIVCLIVAGLFLFSSSDFSLESALPELTQEFVSSQLETMFKDQRAYYLGNNTVRSLSDCVRNTIPKINDKNSKPFQLMQIGKFYDILEVHFSWDTKVDKISKDSSGKYRCNIRLIASIETRKAEKIGANIFWIVLPYSWDSINRKQKVFYVSRIEKILPSEELNTSFLLTKNLSGVKKDSRNFEFTLEYSSETKQWKHIGNLYDKKGILSAEQHLKKHPLSAVEEHFRSMGLIKYNDMYVDSDQSVQILKNIANDMIYVENRWIKRSDWQNILKEREEKRLAEERRREEARLTREAARQAELIRIENEKLAKQLAYQKGIEKKLLEGLKNKKENDYELFCRTISIYTRRIGNKRLNEIKTLREILQTAFDFSLPPSSRKRAEILPEIERSAEKQLSGSVIQYTRERRFYYEKLYPLAKKGDKVTIHTNRDGTITGVFYGFSGRGNNIILISTKKIDMLDLDTNSVLMFNDTKRKLFIMQKVNEESIEYRTQFQERIENLRIEKMIEEGYFYYQKVFYSPDELYGYFLRISHKTKPAPAR